MAVDLSDNAFYTQLLLDCSNALFVTGKAEYGTDIVLECLWQPQRKDDGSLAVTRTRTSTELGLRVWLETPPPRSCDTYMFIPQASSWSPLKISLDMFRILYQHFKIFPAFIGVVSGFGLKTSEIEEQSPTCHCESHYSDEEMSTLSSCEIAYNFYHVEEHGRHDLKDPWSIRQTAVYQKLFLAQCSSTWIFVQLAKPLRDAIETMGEAEKAGTGIPYTPLFTPIALHILIFKASQRNWKDYTRYLSQQLSNLHEVACFSEVGHRATQDYTLEFVDCQNMELVQRKIRRALSIMQAQMRTLLSIKAYNEKFQQMNTNEFNLTAQLKDHLELRLQECYEMMGSYIHDLESLLQSAEGTRSLLFKILDHRNDAVVHDNGYALRHLAQKSSSQSDLMISTAELAQYDSKILKVISFIAMIYLPISLVSSFFSSNIVQLASMNAVSPSAELRKEVGLFVGVTTILTGLTLAGTSYWTRNDRMQRTVRPSTGA